MPGAFVPMRYLLTSLGRALRAFIFLPALHQRGSPIAVGFTASYRRCWLATFQAENPCRQHPADDIDQAVNHTSGEMMLHSREGHKVLQQLCPPHLS
jgi:hypothetical protein